MIKIKLTTSFPEWPLERQTPHSSGMWGNCKFYINEDVDECDFWVIYEGLRKPDKSLCAPENTIFITGEPPNVKKYDQRFLKQFNTVITFRRDIEHPNIIHSQTALPWHVGRRVQGTTNISFSSIYDELEYKSTVRKDRLLSVISSNKQFTEEHRKRLQFIVSLRRYFHNSIDIFGRGIKDIEDKWDAIAPYKYHIVIENGSFPDYFTEKLSDTFLCGSFPFYYGAPNLSQYFPQKSFTAIDIESPDKAFNIISENISEKIYDKSISEISTARDLVLKKYNLFPMIYDIIKNRDITIPKKYLQLNPIFSFV